MTEEIIIDGVNVNACRFFTVDSFHPLTNSDCSAHCTPYPECVCYDTCDEHPDCYYKQLKRAEIEIEKLKGVDGNIHPDSAYYKITRLELENKQMKSVLEEINRVVELAHKVEDYLLGQDYTDLVDRIEKEINEVLK